MRSAGQALKAAGGLLNKVIGGASVSGRFLSPLGIQLANTAGGVECRSLHSQGSADIIPESKIHVSSHPSHLYSFLQKSFPYIHAQISTVPANQSRSFSANAEEADPAGEGTASPKKRRKNLIDVVRPMPNWGLGGKVMKSHWEEGSYYELTRVKVNKDGSHGDAWGIFHRAGSPTTGESLKIGGSNKRLWREAQSQPPIVWKRT